MLTAAEATKEAIEAKFKAVLDGGGNGDRMVSSVTEAFETDEIKALLPPGATQTPILATGELGFTALLTKKADDGDMAKKPEAGKVETFEVAPGVFMEFCWIPPTTAAVQLGSPKAEQDYLTKTSLDGKREDWLDDESETARGTFTTKGFWLGKYEVTQGEWEKVMGVEPERVRRGEGQHGEG